MRRKVRRSANPCLRHAIFLLSLAGVCFRQFAKLSILPTLNLQHCDSRNGTPSFADALPSLAERYLRTLQLVCATMLCLRSGTSGKSAESRGIWIAWPTLASEISTARAAHGRLRANKGGPNLEEASLVRQGDIVRFRAADVFLPVHDELNRILAPTEEFEGTVVDISDAGMKPRIFAIVEVVARQTMVVPIAKLHPQ